MPNDAYQPCPCGIDKKIKFCCGAEVIHDLQKVEEALQGEQRLGALDLVNRMLSSKRERPCLHMYKAMVQLAMKELEPARKTASEMLEIAPGNPAGLAIAAMLDCYEDNLEGAIEKLQTALDAQQGKLVNAVYEAIGVVGRALAVGGEPIAAQAHLLMQTGATRGQDQQALMALLELEGSGQIPLAVQGSMTLIAADANSPLTAADIAEFNAALRLSDVGCWLAAAKKFEEIATRTPNDPAVWKNIGILRARIINNGVAIQALRRYAGFASVPRDHAVEADALAQYLSEPAEVDFVPEITTTFTVEDPQAIKEHLISSKRVQTVPFDEAMFREENEVPPIGAFLVLDREIPATSANLSRDNVPKVMGEILLYGKETDRPARLEFVAVKTSDYEAKLKALRDAVGEFTGIKQQEEQSGRMSAVSAAMAINWRFPDDTPLDLRKKMIEEHRTLALLSIWPNLPMGVLDGKTPRVAVADTAGQIRVQAVILMMDLAEPEESPDFNKLRRSLGLPTSEPIDPEGVRVATLTPAQQTRLVTSKLSDTDLVNLYRRAVMYGAPRLVLKLGREVVARPSLDKHPEVSKAETYDMLSRLAGDMDEALSLVLKAQEAAKAQGLSPARYLLAELPLRIRRMEEQETKRVLNTLTTKHMREPGVAQAVYGLLAQLGLLQVDPATGRAVLSPAAAAAAGTPSGGPSGSGLWTPDQGIPGAIPEAPAPASKSKLWLPGME